MSDNARGALAMALAMLAFTTNDAIMKLSFDGAPVGQAIVVRGMFSLSFGLALAYATGALSKWRTALHPLIAVRGAFDAAAAACFLTALSLISFVTLYATIQVTPLIATALAAVILRERVGWRRWAATAVGLLGVLLVIDPFSGGGASIYAFLGLGAALCAAGRDLSTRGMPSETPTLLIALTGVAAITAMGGIMSVVGRETWVALDAATVGALAAAAIGVMAGNYFVSLGMRIGEVSAVSPARYTVVIWAMLIGWLVFADVPTGQGFVGVAVVIAAGLYTLRREKARQQPITEKAGMRGAV